MNPMEMVSLLEEERTPELTCSSRAEEKRPSEDSEKVMSAS